MKVHCIERSSDYIFWGGGGVGSRALDIYSTTDKLEWRIVERLVICVYFIACREFLQIARVEILAFK
jgi:hypothetical protein